MFNIGFFKGDKMIANILGISPRYIPYGFQDASRRQGSESPGA